MALALMAVTTWSGAATVSHMQVDRQGDSYVVSARIHLDVPRHAAYAAATDFARLADYSPMIDASRLLGHHKLFTRMHMCVFWFCKTVDQVMRYHLDAPKSLTMKVVPNSGDLSAGSAHWQFIAVGVNATVLLFKATVTPAFWVPPLIGPWAISNALRDQVRTTAQAIEQLARENSPSHPGGTP